MNRRDRAVRVGDTLFDEVPIVVEEGSRCFGRNLLHAAGLRIVEVRDEQDVVRRNRIQAIGCVVGERPIAALRHVAVCVVQNLTQRRGGTEDGSVLVEIVGGIGVCCAIERGKQQVSDVVIRVGILRALCASA